MYMNNIGDLFPVWGTMAPAGEESRWCCTLPSCACGGPGCTLPHPQSSAVTCASALFSCQVFAIPLLIHMVMPACFLCSEEGEECPDCGLVSHCKPHRKVSRHSEHSWTSSFPSQNWLTFILSLLLSLLYCKPGASTILPLSAVHIGDHIQCWQDCRCNKVVDVCNNKFQLSIPETSQPYLQSWRTQPWPLGPSSEVRSSVSSALLKSQRRRRRFWPATNVACPSVRRRVGELRGCTVSNADMWQRQR